MVGLGAASRAVGAFVCLLLVVARVPEAAAHQSSIAYQTLHVDDERRVIDYALRISSADLYEALGLERDRAATAAEVVAGRDRLFDHVRSKVSLTAEPSRDCPVEPGELSVEGTWVQLRWRWRCPQVVEAFELSYRLFFDLDPLHTSPVTATWAGQRSSSILEESRTAFRWVLGQAPPSGFLAFVRAGVDHILFGFDHLAFLLSLLVISVIAGRAGVVTLRGGRDALRYAVAIVSSFTIAHSITLVVAALGVIPIHSQVVESAIALSIIYVAIENIVRSDPPRRYVIGFAFGLIHGLGFASMLRELLPSEGLVVPVVAFNLGVELGQLGVVTLVLPLLMACARALGSDRYRRRFATTASAILALLGLVWLVERLTGLSILPL